MTRPTILDRDDVAVVPRKPTAEMASRGADAFFSPSPESVAQENARAAAVFRRALSVSHHSSAWQEVREYVAGLEKKEARASASLTGLLEALEHHTGERHGIMAIRHLVDRIATIEAENERMRKVINQTRLAFGGMVSVQSVIDLIDTLGSAHNASGPRSAE